MAANRRDVFEAEEDAEDYFSEPYEDFGDVEDVGVLTSDPEQREYERDQGFPISSSSQKPPKQFLIQSTEYLQGFKEKMLGEQIEKYETIRRAHMVFRLNGWESSEGQEALQKAEDLMRRIYTE